jgi:predicted nicotinamide N-methyase
MVLALCGRLITLATQVQVVRALAAPQVGVLEARVQVLLLVGNLAYHPQEESRLLALLAAFRHSAVVGHQFLEPHRRALEMTSGRSRL